MAPALPGPREATPGHLLPLVSWEGKISRRFGSNVRGVRAVGVHLRHCCCAPPAPGQHRRKRGRRQLHRVHAHPRRLGSAQPLRVEALFLRGERVPERIKGRSRARSADEGLPGAVAGARRGSWSIPRCCTPSRSLTTSTGSGTAKAALAVGLAMRDLVPRLLPFKNKRVAGAMSGRRRGCALLVCIFATAVVLPRRGFTSSMHAWPTSAPCTSSRGGADSVHQVWSRAGACRWCAGGLWQRPSGCIRRCGLDATLRLRGGDMGPRAELEPEGACISQKSYVALYIDLI